MKIGVVITETWSFFQEIYDLFQEKHQVTRFKPEIRNYPILQERLNRYQYQKGLRQFLDQQAVTFFEWASETLAHATQQPKKTGIVARLHRYEMYQWSRHINWENVDRLIVVSKAKELEILERFPVLKGKVVVIPEAVNIDHFTFEPKNFRKQIGILCHLSPRKRVYELILAFAEYNLGEAGFHLHIGGGEHPKFADYYRALHHLVHELNLEKHITFYNHIDNAQNWYRNIDIFISNSYSEGLQVSPIEAMACGVYPLAHRWEGADELLPEQNLYWTNKEMDERIREYSQKEETQRIKERQELRKRVEERFNVFHTREKIMEIVEAVGNQYQ